jgi:spermidine synthase
MKKSSAWLTYFYTFLLAFCSLFYELIYAQILSVCLGGTKNQYLTIIALFTCALGFGSIVQAKLKLRTPVRKLFLRIEIALSLMGLAGPFLIVWILQPGSTETFRMTAVFLSYFFVFIVGFLSGFEIPCLFDLLEGAQGKILAFDYLGMLAATVLFPFLFLPYLGTAASLLVVVGANLMGLVWLRSENPKASVSAILYALIFCYIVSVIGFREELNHQLSLLYLGGT